MEKFNDIVKKEPIREVTVGLKEGWVSLPYKWPLNVKNNFFNGRCDKDDEDGFNGEESGKISMQSVIEMFDRREEMLIELWGLDSYLTRFGGFYDYNEGDYYSDVESDRGGGDELDEG